MGTYLFLHPLLNDKHCFDTLIEEIKEDKNANCISFNFSGHGENNINAEFTIDLFLNDLIIFVESNNLSNINLIGHSLGGYVGILFSNKFPEKVKSLIIIGTKTVWTEEYAEGEFENLNPELISQKYPVYYQTLDSKHKIGAKAILNRIEFFIKQMPKNANDFALALSSITTPLIFCRGKLDKICLTEDIEYSIKLNPNIQFLEFEGSKHLLEHFTPKSMDKLKEIILSM